MGYNLKDSCGFMLQGFIFNTNNTTNHIIYKYTLLSG